MIMTSLVLFYSISIDQYRGGFIKVVLFYSISRGGVALYIHCKFKHKIRKDIHIEGIENIFIEIENKFGKKYNNRNII